MGRLNRKMINKLITNRKVVFREDPDIPENMLIELTNACNHACIFCAHAKMKRKIGFMEFELCKRILEEAFLLGTTQVGFYMTGEPLLYPRIEDVIKTAKKIGYKYIYMTTNGTLAEIEVVKRLIAAGLDSVKFSINGGNKTVYKSIHKRDEYEHVLNNLRDIVAFKTEQVLDFGVFVSYVKTKQNLEFINDFELLMNKIGIDQLVVVDAYDQGGNMMEEKKEFMLEPEKKYMKAPCHMVFNRLHVTYEGYLNACCVDFDNYLAVEDLKILSLKEAWNSKQFRTLRRRHLEKDLEGIMCKRCIENDYSGSLEAICPNLQDF